jgi:hypothetical protein
MNPLLWKCEHQIALVCTIAVGFVFGVLIGFQQTGYSSFRWGALYCEHGYYSCVYLLNGYWIQVFSWGVLGGLIGATFVYIRQLLRT